MKDSMIRNIVLSAALGTLLVLVLAADNRTRAGGVPPGSGATAAITTEEIERMLASHAAPKVVEILMRLDEADRTPIWDFVISNIEKGKVEWLKVALQLSPGRDGAVAEDLAAAEAEALPRVPSLVLRLFGAGVCFIPETKWPESLAAFRQETARRAALVRSVPEPGLQKQKDQCLKSYVDDAKQAEQYYAQK